MQTELAQIISLTSYGNEFITDGTIDGNYFPGNTVFQHCNLVDFRDFKKPLFSSKPVESISANNPIDWFKLLKKEGCIKLRLYYQSAAKNEFGPEYMLSGFTGGAGTWLIETCFNKYSHYWQKRWQVTNKDTPDNKIWAVNYARVVKRFPVINQQRDINNTKLKLTETVKELIEFCIATGLRYWPEVFQKADKMLSDPTPNRHYYHHDLLVIKNYSLAAQQLLFAAGEAWVFGGMGSWNDMGFSDTIAQKNYLKLTQQLYEQLLESILAATNSF